MDFFKKRSVAVGVFVVTVILFTLIGSHRSLDRACRKAEDAFFDKSLLRSEGYHTCPGEQLAYCVDDANRLLSVIGSDGEWAGAYEALLTARRDLAASAAENARAAVEAAQAAVDARLASLTCKRWRPQKRAARPCRTATTIMTPSSATCAAPRPFWMTAPTRTTFWPSGRTCWALSPPISCAI